MFEQKIDYIDNESDAQPTAVVTHAELPEPSAYIRWALNGIEAGMEAADSWDAAEDVKIQAIDAIRALSNPKGK